MKNSCSFAMTLANIFLNSRSGMPKNGSAKGARRGSTAGLPPPFQLRHWGDYRFDKSIDTYLYVNVNPVAFAATRCVDSWMLVVYYKRLHYMVRHY